MAEKLEITAQQYEMAQRALQLVQRLEANPDAKPLLEKAIKTVHPEVQTEEDIVQRAAAPYIQELQGLRQEFTSFMDEQKKARDEADQRAAANQLDAAFARLQSNGYTQEGLNKIKEIMVSRNVADPEAAAALFDRLNPPAPSEQPGWAPQGWEIGQTADQTTDLKALFADPDKWADNEAARYLNEIRVGGS